MVMAVKPQLKPNASLIDKLEYIKKVADPVIYNNVKTKRVIKEGFSLATNSRDITYSTDASNNNTFAAGSMEVRIPYWITTCGAYPCLYIGVPYGHNDYAQGYDAIQRNYRYRVSAELSYSKSINEVPFLEEYRDKYPDYWILGWDYASGQFLNLDSDLSTVDCYTQAWTIQTLEVQAKSAVSQLIYYLDTPAWMRIAEKYNPITKKIELHPAPIAEQPVESIPTELLDGEALPF
jgi:hypothetical protein